MMNEEQRARVMGCEIDRMFELAGLSPDWLDMPEQMRMQVVSTFDNPAFSASMRDQYRCLVVETLAKQLPRPALLDLFGAEGWSIPRTDIDDAPWVRLDTSAAIRVAFDGMEELERRSRSRTIYALCAALARDGRNDDFDTCVAVAQAAITIEQLAMRGRALDGLKRLHAIGYYVPAAQSEYGISW